MPLQLPSGKLQDASPVFSTSGNSDRGEGKFKNIAAAAITTITTTPKNNLLTKINSLF